jgi:hypothetical protein
MGNEVERYVSAIEPDFQAKVEILDTARKLLSSCAEFAGFVHLGQPGQNIPSGAVRTALLDSARDAERRVGIGLADAEQHSPTSEVAATATRLRVTFHDSGSDYAPTA